MHPTPFGRYRLIAPLGRGGMGQVFRAYDTETERMVALKVLPDNMAQDPAFKERLRREAHATARLHDPHVIPLHHFGEIDGRLYLDMKLVEGRDLRDLLTDAPRGLDPRQAVDIIAQIAPALDEAHRSGLVHRDVKPSNILVTPNGFAYLIDFGIARADEDSSLTATGFAVGTVSYMAPEQLDGRIDPRSDTYALTCVLFQCLTGRPPFTGSMRDKIAAHIGAPPPVPSRENPSLTAAFDGIIARGMAKDVTQRYQTTVELADAAQRALLPWAPPTQPVPQPTPTPVRVAAPPPPTQPARLQNPRDGVLNTTPIRASGAVARRPPPVWWRRRRTAAWASALASLSALIAAILATTSSIWTVPSIRPDVPLQTGAESTWSAQIPNAMSLGADGAGAAYVGIPGGAVVKLLADGTSQGEISLDGYSARGLVVLPDSAAYVVDPAGTVVKFAAGFTDPEELPFDGLANGTAIAVAENGAVYASDAARSRVMVLEPGSSAAVDLGVSGLPTPQFLAVDYKRNLYVASADRLVRVNRGASDVEEVTGEPAKIGGLAVDSSGNVYASDSRAGVVTRMSSTGGAWMTLPFPLISEPASIALDREDNVYVYGGTGEVTKLAAES